MTRYIAKLQLAAADYAVRLRTERGASSVEYSMLAALIAAVIAAFVVTLGEQVNAAFKSASDKF